jgi:multiple sugar transport system substrate-binding protein
MPMHLKRPIAAIVAVAAAVALVGCGATAPEPTVDGPVTIVVGNQPLESAPEQLALFQAKVEEFQRLHPDITIEAESTTYDPQTFNAMLSGGTLPTTLQVPFINMPGLIEQGAVKDITALIDGDELLSSLNPNLRAVTEGADGNAYGVPVSSSTFALIYNRSHYEAAGLDPDDPPTTWEELRENARILSEELGITGFTIPTTENTGGWSVTAVIYSHGATIEEVDGDDVTVDLTSEAAVDTLQLFHDLRFEDDAFGDNILLANKDVQTAFAAGTIGQYAGSAVVYRNLVTTYEQDPEEIGIAPLPQGPDGLGTLGGGNISIINPRATDAEAAAALEWIKFSYLNKYSSETEAVADAKVSLATGVPVGAPAVPLFSQEVEDQYFEWIAPYIDVNRDNYTVYLENIANVEILPEPPVAAGAIYGLLSTVVQDVLSDPSADIEAILERAETSAQALVDAG